MKTCLLLCAFILCQFSNLPNGVSGASSVYKPGGYFAIPGTKGVYKYHDYLKNWDQAAAICASEGASLFYADNTQEFDAVIRFWRAVRNDFNKPFYYGAFRFGAAGAFRTISAIPLSSVHHVWLPGEPNNVGGREHCVEVGVQSFTVFTFGLNDVHCDADRRFMCKVPMVDVQCTSTAYGISGASSVYKPGYVAIPGTKGVYKYHDNLKIWDQAAAICASEGASLFYADNTQEFDAVIRFWRTVRNDFTHPFYYGAFRFGDSFRAISAIPLSSVHNVWLPGVPNNVGGRENCVEVGVQNFTVFTFGLNYVHCDDARRFMCKVPMVDVQCTSTAYRLAASDNMTRKALPTSINSTLDELTTTQSALANNTAI